VLGECFEKAADLAAAREMLAHCPEHDHAHPRISVEDLEGYPQLLALGHRNHIQRPPVEDDVAALVRWVDLDAKPIDLAGQGRDQRRNVGHRGSLSYSPATSLRRSILPTGDFGISATKIQARGRL